MLHAVILAGGSGTRFWPASRAALPKQLLAMAGGEPLVAATVRRLEGLIPPERILVVTNPRQAPGLRRALPRLAPDRIVAEPEPRDTAPCIALAALLVGRADPEAVMAVLPADHVIGPVLRFQAALADAARLAADRDVLVTFGIPPRFPATGYGYIQRGEPLPAAGGRPFYRVQTFREKPDEATAREWLDRGGFLWNSGMFVWRAEAVLDEIRRCAPGLGAMVDRLQPALGTPAWEEVLASAFPAAPRRSIDREVMERSQRVVVAEADFDWDDLGSWQALPAHHPRDAAGNVAVLPAGGLHVDLGSRDLLVYATTDHVVATIGLSGLTVVHTPDATLICPTGRSQEVKELIEELRRQGREDVL